MLAKSGSGWDVGHRLVLGSGIGIGIGVAIGIGIRIRIGSAIGRGYFLAGFSGGATPTPRRSGMSAMT